MPAIICTGGTVNACEDGKCVCNAPATSASTCETRADCEEFLECNEGLAPSCWEGDCICEPPEETPANDDEPTTTCNLHIREYYPGALHKKEFRVEYRVDKDGENVAEDALGGKKWDEEILVETADTGLVHPVSFTMSTEKEPGPRCEEPPDIAPGGNIHKRQKSCLVPQERLHLVKLKYGDLEWDSRPDQDADEMPHCEVGDWEVGGWQGIETRFPNREMDCRFPC